MKYKPMGLVLLGLLCGCSVLNPFHKTEDKTALNQPNPFLWEASKDKLQNLALATENPKEGLLATTWQKSGNTEFKIEVKVVSSVLSSNALKVAVYERQSPAETETANLALEKAVEQEIFNEARALYRQSLALK